MPIFEPEEEKKSYSAVFLVTIGMLLVGSIWAVWDDNILRRPWKNYQSDFFDLEHQKISAELAAEDERLSKEPEYQEAAKALEAAQAKVSSGGTAAKLDELDGKLEGTKVRESEVDLSIRIVKSEIEEARYEFEHAQELGKSGDSEKAHLEAKEQEKVELDRQYAEAQAERAAVEKEIEGIRSEVTALEEKLRELGKERELIAGRLDALTTNFPLGPVTLRLPPIPKIQQVVMNEFDRNAFDEPTARVDRCVSCHAGINKPGFEEAANPFKTHPDRQAMFAAHPPDRFGCTPCHDGQGAAVNSPAMAHGEVMFWEEPLLRGADVQARCVSCHVEVQRIAHTGEIASGERLFEQLGCHGCHLTEGYEDLPKVGPSLRNIAAKDDPGWMVSWVEDPHKFRPRSKMPWFLFNREQSEQVVAYLLSKSKEHADKWLESHGEPASVNPADPLRVEQGKHLTESIGCKGCHAFTPEEVASPLSDGKDIAPNLSRVGEKTSARWIYNWVKDPRSYDPDTRMPSLRLSDDEAGAITSYLLTLKSAEPEPLAADLAAKLASPEAVAAGEKLIRKYGCAGCHDIPGMENESRVGVELSFFAGKTLEELYFGYAHEIPRTWDDWTINKIKSPRIYETEFIEQAMPNFRLGDPEAKTLRVFLHGRIEHKVPPKFRYPEQDGRMADLVTGRRLVERYNCVGCHTIDGRGGAIQKYYVDNPNLAPPNLYGEGSKVKVDWLFRFLKGPEPIRPWLTLRMPTFGLSDAETQQVVDYFLAQDKITQPLNYVDASKIPQENLQAAVTLVSADYFACFSCHQQGDKKPEGPPEGWAPDLALAHERLNPGWIPLWLEDPQKLMPGTKMPSFYPGGPEDVFGGDEPRQREALRDYLISLGHPGARLAQPAQVPAEASATGDEAQG